MLRSPFSALRSSRQQRTDAPLLPNQAAIQPIGTAATLGSRPRGRLGAPETPAQTDRKVRKRNGVAQANRPSQRPTPENDRKHTATTQLIRSSSTDSTARRESLSEAAPQQLGTKQPKRRERLAQRTLHSTETAMRVLCTPSGKSRQMAKQDRLRADSGRVGAKKAGQAKMPEVMAVAPEMLKPLANAVA